MNTSKLTARQKDQLLDHFAHYMSMEVRYRLMAELPRAYNAWAEREVVRVIQLAFDEPVQCRMGNDEEQKGQAACHYVIEAG
jgi:hypothetical protein